MSGLLVVLTVSLAPGARTIMLRASDSSASSTAGNGRRFQSCEVQMASRSLLTGFTALRSAAQTLFQSINFLLCRYACHNAVVVLRRRLLNCCSGDNQRGDLWTRAGLVKVTVRGLTVLGSNLTFAAVRSETGSGGTWPVISAWLDPILSSGARTLPTAMASLLPAGCPADPGAVCLRGSLPVLDVGLYLRFARAGSLHLTSFDREGPSGFYERQTGRRADGDVPTYR